MKNEEKKPAGKRSWKRIGWRILRLLILCYLVLLIGAWAFQSKMVYAPTSKILATPADSGLDYIEKELTTSDGIKIKTWFVPGDKKKKLVLFCHGNAGNMSYRISYLLLFHKMGMNVLTLDYRGFGQSGGSPSEEGTYIDARAAWKHARENLGFGQKDIIIYGRSLGGAIAARLALEKKPAALVLESTFTSIPDMGSEFFPILPARLISKYSYDTLSIIVRINCPKLIMHSVADNLIGFHHGRDLFEAAAEPKEFVELPAGGHNSVMIESREQMVSALIRFLGGL